MRRITLHIKGTPFQLKVWQALLDIPAGSLQSYGTVAQAVGSPNAARAVGTAVGQNPVALLIPCHRVIRESGIIGGYRWQRGRKSPFWLTNWETLMTLDLFPETANPHANLLPYDGHRQQFRTDFHRRRSRPFILKFCSAIFPGGTTKP